MCTSKNEKRGHDVPCRPGEPCGDNQKADGEGTRNVRSRPGCGARSLRIERRYGFTDDAFLDEQPHAGDEADETANRTDIEESAHGDAAISVRPREANQQKGKPKPARERADKTRQEAEDDGHEREVRG